MDIKTQWITLHNQDVDISAFVAMPVTEGIYPGVVVVQEIFGVNEHIRDVTSRIAQEGYVAIAPAIYQRIAPNFETGYTAEDVKIGREYKNQTKASELLQDIQTAIDYLYTLPQVKKTGVGAMGFCFGGHVTYLTATLEDIKATASYYGAGIVNWCPGESEPTITHTKDIKGAINCYFGMDDQSIPPEQVDQIENELQKYNINHQVFRYPNAEHGFNCGRRSSYNPTVARQAWQETLKLFQSCL
ncbi:dienelactone hydrolase [Cyanobacterium stanieri PCC 7202]|uniref:Dienelactone hydrolase n=1 Tax=Cyanobacterium stanieri (strain ATCC 29140 / PCC 7202) TaxID=292563 RepID=K9YM56_CYASC|nr:dienelactone hydrolase [Cyanobacterium stanieri PCC 7202]